MTDETSSPKERQPLVAVILVAYGGRDDTLACIKSLKESDYANYKIILVDNDSPDDTSDCVRAQFPNMIIIESARNLGFAGGNNLGILKAMAIGADYIFLLNNDTIIASNTISKLVQTADRFENLGAIGPKIYYYGESDKIWSAGGVINFNWSNLYHIGIRKKDSAKYSAPRAVDYLTGCAIMFPVARVREIGKLDESYWMYYEDADYCVRLAKAGYSIMFEPDGKVWHKVSSSTGGNLSCRKMHMKFKSGFAFFLKHSPSPFWFITYPLSQLVSLFRATFAID